VSELGLKGIVEALLFSSDTPVTLDRLASVLENFERSDIRKAIDDLAKEYDESDRAFTVTKLAGGWQLYARPSYSKWVRELSRGRASTRLSQAALETLAIVAYKQPIVRAEIEGVRGVDSSGVLATLLKRDLIAIAGRAPGMGRALMYRTTKEFLRYFGLDSVTDLPRLEEFAEVLGLKPEEIEATVEGAESAGALVDAAGALADEPSDASDISTGGEESPSASTAIPDGGETDEGVPAEEHEETAAFSAIGSGEPPKEQEAGPATADAQTASGTSTKLLVAPAAPHDGDDDALVRPPFSMHTVSDSEIAAPVDED